LVLESYFVRARFRSRQIYHPHTFTLNKFQKRLLVKAIARAFGVQPKDVQHTLEKGNAIPRGRGEHPGLEEDIGQPLIDWITSNAQNHTAVNRTELLHDCRETFGAAVTAGWVDSFLLRDKLELSETIS
jgi:hypothetical protein